MAGLKTLGQIAKHLAESGKAGANKKEVKAILKPGKPVGEPVFDNTQKSAEYLPEYLIDADLCACAKKMERKTVSIITAPLKQKKQITIPNNRKVYITDDRAGLAKAVADELSSRGIPVELFSISNIQNDILNRKEDFLPAGGLVIIPDPEEGEKKPAENTKWYMQDDLFLKDAFILANHFAKDLIDSAQQKGAIFATITRLDGAFGFKGNGVQNPLQGGLAGLVKTASIEWEKGEGKNKDEWKGVSCRAIDVAPEWKDNKAIAKAVAAELVNHDPFCPVEIGLDPVLEPDLRYEIKLESSPYASDQNININLNRNDVVIVTGGARGITALAAYALALQVKPTLVLVGRSPEPASEPDWLDSVEDEALIKKAILKNEFSGNNATPLQVEKFYKKHMANREISKNLEKLKSTGANVIYYSADIRNSDEVNRIFDDVRAKYGSVKGIIHGSGVLKDRLITDKTLEQFEDVFDTKVKGLKTLRTATKDDDLKYLVLFSSISARFGNKGQVDYAMANEVLNKIAQQESKLHPDCRVISINWGPWDGGMVTGALKREFEKNSIDLIPANTGAMCMLYEMAVAEKGPAEVVLGTNMIFGKKTKKIKTDNLSQKVSLFPQKKETMVLSFKHEIDVEKYPILKDHILDGKPVVPFALITEWLSHGALHENPGLYLSGFDDMRLLNGIKLDKKKKIIRLLTGKAIKKGSTFEVPVEIRNGIKDNKELIHFRAKAILTHEPAQMSDFNKSEFDEFKYDEAQTYNRDIDEVYEKILFHGRKLRGIKKIINCSSRSMTALISSAPLPARWAANPLRSKWVVDPLILDSAFQMATVWCYEEKGIVSLPSYCAGYRQFCKDFPLQGVTAILEIKKADRHKMRGDFTFLDQNNTVAARLTGYEAVMDASLYKAFKPDFS